MATTTVTYPTIVETDGLDSWVQVPTGPDTNVDLSALAEELALMGLRMLPADDLWWPELVEAPAGSPWPAELRWIIEPA